MAGLNPQAQIFNNNNNQSAIDAAIKKQLEAQNTAITNNIVKQSANVPYRNPASYFYGGNAPGIMGNAGNNLYLKQNVATPQMQALLEMLPVVGGRRSRRAIAQQNASRSSQNAAIQAENAKKQAEYDAIMARQGKTFDQSQQGGNQAYQQYLAQLMSQYNLLG